MPQILSIPKMFSLPISPFLGEQEGTYRRLVSLLSSNPLLENTDDDESDLRLGFLHLSEPNDPGLSRTLQYPP